MSRWGGAEIAILERLRTGGPARDGPALPGLQGVRTLATAATSDLAAIAIKSFPAVFVIWAGFDVTNESKVVGSQMQPEGRCRFLVQCWATSGLAAGAARGTENGAYDLLDQVRRLLLGWVPPPGANEQHAPMKLLGEEVLNLEGGSIALQATYGVDLTIRSL